MLFAATLATHLLFLTLAVSGVTTHFYGLCRTSFGACAVVHTVANPGGQIRL